MPNYNPDMSGLKNLADRTPEERSEIAKKGNAASNAKRRENNSLRKALQVWLQSDSGVKDKNGQPLSGTQLMVAVAVKEMSRGNPKFWEIIRDTAGQKPVEKVEQVNIDIEYQESVDYVKKLMEGME